MRKKCESSPEVVLQELRNCENPGDGGGGCAQLIRNAADTIEMLLERIADLEAEKEMAVESRRIATGCNGGKVNQEIRATAKAHGVKMYQIAEALGIQDSALSRRMRHELPNDERIRILAVIDQLSSMKKRES